MNKTTFLKLLNDHISIKYGSQAEYARHMGTRAAMMSSMCRGFREPTKEVLKDLGLVTEKITVKVYRSEVHQHLYAEGNLDLEQVQYYVAVDGALRLRLNDMGLKALYRWLRSALVERAATCHAEVTLYIKGGESSRTLSVTNVYLDTLERNMDHFREHGNLVGVPGLGASFESWLRDQMNAGKIN